MASTKLSPQAAKKAARIHAAAWIAVGKFADREGDRAMLVDGDVHEIDLAVVGNVDGTAVDFAVNGRLTIGHESQSNSSKACDQAQLLALVLSHVPRGVQEDLLANLPNTFAEQGELPEVDAVLLERTKTLLDRLRVRSTITKKGPVSFHARAEEE